MLFLVTNEAFKGDNRVENMGEVIKGSGKANIHGIKTDPGLLSHTTFRF